MIAALIIAAAGLITLFLIFFNTGGKGDQKQSAALRRDKDAAKVSDMIAKIEKENPELVAKIRSQVAAEKKVEMISKAEDDDIGGVVKHWLSENKTD